MVDGSALGPATAFAAGIVSFASPCVLPLVPGYLSFVSGTGSGEAVGGVATRARVDGPTFGAEQLNCGFGEIVCDDYQHAE